MITLTRILIAISLVALTVSVSSKSSTSQFGSESPHTLSVTGTAQRSLNASLIKIGVTIKTKAPAAREALSQNNRNSSSVGQAINGLGIPDANITTTDFNIRAVYKSIYNETSKTYYSEFDGYEVSNSLEVSSLDPNIAAQLIDDVITAGATTIDYVRFDVTPAELARVKNNLITQAAADAYHKAVLAARPLNVKIDDVQSISIRDYNIPTPRPLYRLGASDMAAEAAPAPTLYTSNTNTASVDIYVVFIVSKRR